MSQGFFFPVFTDNQSFPTPEVSMVLTLCACDFLPAQIILCQFLSLLLPAFSFPQFGGLMGTFSSHFPFFQGANLSLDQVYFFFKYFSQ